MLTASGSAGELVLQPTAIEPQDVADALFKGIEEDRFLILPHPEVAEYYQARATEPDRWLHGMNRLQRQWEEATAR
ncbi:SDR family oxidoreductase [Streptomyces violaceorubidus]